MPPQVDPLRAAVLDQIEASELTTIIDALRVQVQGVVLVPTDASFDPKWVERFAAQLQAARAKYLQMLGGTDTFFLRPEVLVVQGTTTSAGYADEIHAGLGRVLLELLEHRQANPAGHTRHTVPTVFAVMILDPTRSHRGFAVTLNGWDPVPGVDPGSGIVLVSHRNFDDANRTEPGKFQSTLIHELGHAFGLRHCWERPPGDHPAASLPKYSETQSPSVMSFNTSHWTDATTLDEIPGSLVLDDRYDLANNGRVFPWLSWKPQVDNPDNEVIFGSWAGPLRLTQVRSPMWDARPSFPYLTNPASLEERPQHVLRPFTAPFDGAVMWHSAKLSDPPWADLNLRFARPTTLTRVEYYLGAGSTHVPHLALYQLEAVEGKKNGQTNFTNAGEPRMVLHLGPTPGVKRLGVRFSSSPSQYVVVRGIRFWNGDTEVYPIQSPAQSLAERYAPHWARVRSTDGRG